MVTIKFPTLKSGETIGVFSYATGSNIARGLGSQHKPDFSDDSLDQSSFRMTVNDSTFDTGENVSFSFSDPDGNPVIVDDAIIQRSTGGELTGDQLQGLIIATGKTQSGEKIAVIVDFDEGAEISTTFGYAPYPPGGAPRNDIHIAEPVNFLYMGNYADSDRDESDTLAESTRPLRKISATSDDHLRMVKMQHIDADGSSSGEMGDDDEGGIYNRGDYTIYTHPLTGKVVYTQPDSTMTWKAEVKVKGELQPRVIKVGVFQMTNGDVFVADDPLYPNELDNLSIESIKLIWEMDRVHKSFSNDRSVNGSRVVCFSHSVPIKTPSGDVAAGKLRIGDAVETMDRGSQIIRWTGTKTVDEIDLMQNPKLRPIRIKQGALGCGLPIIDILVSRQHRMLVRSEIAQAMFGTDEILIPAIKLINLPGIDIATDVISVAYVHFLLDQHEIIFAAGAPSESLLTGEEALKSIDAAAKQEIFGLFPDLGNPVTARFLPPRKMQKQLIAYHASNDTPLLS